MPDADGRLSTSLSLGAPGLIDSSQSRKPEAPQPKVSLLVYGKANRKGALATFESIARQGGRYEVLWTGGRERELERSAHTVLGTAFRNIDVPGGGVGVAVNRALDAARGEFVGLVPAGDILLTGSLRRRLRYFERGAESIVFCAAKAFERGNVVRRRPKRGFDGQILHRLLETGTELPISTVLVRKSVLDRYRPLNADFKILPDYDLILRMARREAFGCIDEVLVEHRPLLTDLYQYDEERLRIYISLHYSWPQLDARAQRLVRFRFARQLIRVGKHSYKKGDFEKAGRIFREVVKVAPYLFRGRRYQFLNFVKSLL